MNSLLTLYGRFLEAGLIVLRQAIRSNDLEWAEAEVELLHNVPSLLNEPNMERHRYFWFTEREHYTQWVSEPGREKAKSRMTTFYEPLWREMEPILLDALSATGVGAAALDEDQR